MLEISRKIRFFGISSRFHRYFFLIFCTKMRISNAKNMAAFDFWENFFSGRKMPEICWKSPFLQIFIGLLPHISGYFCIKILLIAIPNILLKLLEQPMVVPEKWIFFNLSSLSRYFISDFFVTFYGRNFNR